MILIKELFKENFYWGSSKTHPNAAYPTPSFGKYTHWFIERKREDLHVIATHL
jgi:hypothetical protein